MFTDTHFWRRVEENCRRIWHEVEIPSLPKSRFSILLMAVVDANYTFIYTHVGVPGQRFRSRFILVWRKENPAVCEHGRTKNEFPQRVTSSHYHCSFVNKHHLISCLCVTGVVLVCQIFVLVFYVVHDLMSFCSLALGLCSSSTVSPP